MSIFKQARKRDIAVNLKELQNIEDPNTFSDLPQEEKERIIEEQKNKYLNNRGDQVKLEHGKFKSVYQADANALFQKLNQVSPSFCLAKWFNVSIHIPTGRTHSCYHPPSHYIPLEEIAADPGALHNTQHKKEQRRMMLQGERPKECFFCWNIEDSGSQLSDRAYRSKDVYRPGIFKEVADLSWDGNAKPRYVEVNFNQACNLKCSYCSPHLSTAWHKEVNELGPIQLADGRRHNDTGWMARDNMIPDNGPNNPYLKAFWEWFPEVYPTLQTFRMTGGEPLMDKNTFKVFDYVLANPTNPNFHLSITSNCSPPGNQWEKFLDSLNALEDANAIDHFMLYCSLDSWGPQAEYIRTGLDFDRMHKNVTEYLRRGRKHSLTFIVTYCAMSLPGWRTYLENILRLREEFNTDRQLIWFDTPMLMDPDWLSLKLYTPDMLKSLEESIEFMQANKEVVGAQFKGFKDYEIAKVQRLLDWARVPYAGNLDQVRANFYAYVTQHDQRRGTNFTTTFPELTDLYEQSKVCYDKIKQQ